MFSQAGSVTRLTGDKLHGLFHELANVLLQGFGILAQHRATHPRDQPLVAHVDAVNLDLHIIQIQQGMPLLFSEVFHWLIRWI